MTIRRKMLLATAIPVALTAVLAAGAIVGFGRTGAAHRRLAAATEITGGVFELSFLTYDCLFGRSDRAARQWRSRHQSLTLLLRSLDAGDDRGRQIIGSMQNHCQDLERLFSELAPNSPSPASQPLTQAQEEYRQRAAGQMLGHAHALVTDASLLSKHNRESITRIEDQVELAILVAALVTAAATVLSLTVVGTISRRVGRLRKAVGAIAGGDLDHRTALAGGDELGDLSRAFDDMTAKLQAELDARRHAEEHLLQVNRFLLAVRNINQTIVRETQPRELARQACQALLETGEFCMAWLAVLGAGNRAVAIGQAGASDDFLPVMEAAIREGHLPSCIRSALAGGPGPLIGEQLCQDCPAVAMCPSGRPVVLRLEHAGVTHGILVIHTRSGQMPEQDERALLEELGGDLAYAFSRIALEKERASLQEQFVQAQKMEAIGRLAGGIAHDFRNQLTVIDGFCSLLRAQVAADSPLGPMLEDIHGAAKRSSELTSRLLTLSRKQPLNPQLVQINDVLGELAGPLRSLVGELVVLDLQPAAALPPCRLDRAQLEQAVMNLAVNARDAMPKGGRLVIQTAEVDIDEGYTRLHPELKCGPHVMLSLTDSGVGMDKQTMSRLFEPFFTTKPPGQGTGLGLSMVYAFVRQSEGAVFVYSEPGRGATFKLFFPPAPAEGARAEAGARPSPIAAPGGGETILLAEDNVPVRRFVGAVLTRLGYDVHVSQDVYDACKLAEERPGRVHLLVTDVVMPGLSGPELAQRVRESQPQLKVLYMSGYAGDIIERHVVLKAGWNLLVKPFSADALAQAVRNMLDNGSAS